MGGPVNTLRAILVATAVFAAIVAGFTGQWTAVVVLGIGIVAHGVHYAYFHRPAPRTGLDT